MMYGSKENGGATLKLSAKEHECFKAGEIIKKKTGCASGEYRITVQMERIGDLPESMGGEKCGECGREIKTFMHTCDERSDLIETTGCPYCDDKCEMCGI